MILDKICDKRKEQLERDISNVSRVDIKAMALDKEYKTVSFSKAIKQDTLSVISEVKKASPSKGLICPNFDPVKTATEYEKNGANAISCLTEEHYFQGSAEYLKEIRAAVKLPILRKDFIIDEYQLYEARAIGADAVLLISAILSEEQMKEYSDIAHELGLECLVEVHNEDEYKKTLGFKSDMLGINNRNLYTFDVDLETTGRLSRIVGEQAVLVSESGIKNNADMKQVRSFGADAVLIGDTLMRSGNIGDTLRALREGV
ncbi:indole-3-glycerol phosphate synthase TrpC [Ruminococcus sp.]|uniref:indole-3-glycerol phosphate synthase TrpC n=1 Tax=Ruminococcus sp. TaxID=41978 RepID=UPI0025F0B7FE|nr:indole-3-glycerol phosphate synthase TrpC [Ruminococcus sp.]